MTAAFHAESFLEQVVGVARLVDATGAVEIGRKLVGEELTDIAIFFPRLGRSQVIAVLRLELGHVVRVFEEILAVVEDQDIAVIRETVDRVFDLHLVVAIDRRDGLQIAGIAVFLDHVVERRQGAG